MAAMDVPSTDAPADGTPEVHAKLLELQAADTALDQLRHRRDHLPELEAAQHARRAMLAWESTRANARQRLEELETEIAVIETETAEIDVHKRRLEQQLRTVIAPREAEALQHEIATATSRRGELDDRGLEALEAQADLDDVLSAHLREEAALRESAQTADERLAEVQSELADDETRLERRRAELIEELDAALVQRYGRLRSHHGVAVSRLEGHRCGGCHLDLSAAEMDQIKTITPDEFPECPQCGRLLVR